MDPLTMVGAAVALLALTRKKGSTVSASKTETEAETDFRIVTSSTGERIKLMYVDDPAKNIQFQSQQLAMAELQKKGISFTGNGAIDLDIFGNWIKSTIEPKLNQWARNPANMGKLHQYSIDWANAELAPLLITYTKAYPQSGMSIDPRTNKPWTLDGARSYFRPVVAEGIDVIGALKGMVGFLASIATGNVAGAVTSAGNVGSTWARR